MQIGMRLGLQVRLRAALVEQGTGDFPHHRIIRPADQDRRPPFLCHQPHLHQLLAVVRQRGRGDADPLLQPANRHARLPGAHQGLEDAKPRRIPEGFEAKGDVVDVHISTITETASLVKAISTFIEI